MTRKLITHSHDDVLEYLSTLCDCLIAISPWVEASKPKLDQDKTYQGRDNTQYEDVEMLTLDGRECPK